MSATMFLPIRSNSPRSAPPGRPAMGAPVRFSRVMQRMQYMGQGFTDVYWDTVERPGRGVYVGMRTVYAGRKQWGSEDEPPWLKPEYGITHALVAVTERGAPVRVAFHDLVW